MEKPKHCGQNWLEMSPIEGGRICGKCEKKIIDFSKKSWKEIENIQLQNDNSICGMYNPKQLEYWGQDIPKNKNFFYKSMTIAGLTISFAMTSYGQNENSSDSIIITGKVIDISTNEELPFTSVTLLRNKTEAMTDLEGNFKLIVKNPKSENLSDTLEIKNVGYVKKYIVLDDITKINPLEFTSELKLIPGGITYSVSEPTFIERVKWKIRKIFKLKA
jgi:hypothetical protein